MSFYEYVDAATATALIQERGRLGCIRMVVEFTTTYAISAYHH